MPHLRLRGLSSKQVTEVNDPLVKELSKIVGSPEDHFTFEHVQTSFYFQGQQVNGTPFVEVLWFARDQKTQNACAEAITNHLRKIVGPMDITVIFVELSKTGYFENGSHF